MGVDGLAALVIRRLYDRSGTWVLLAGALCSVPVAPLVYFGGFGCGLTGAILWGIGMGLRSLS
ncbi:MAG: hypothetical protein A4E60_02633 [Syntrophorhabdus sp. PtaB.Bin047]|nr:MAG: hypothetical protein A4E60_02633 [Syntrophorhabdus sp. PtaB.Bin047]OPY76541.1 MAG: hypothetical protein A4E63_00065 [Syntrophorhabdus sp. PtaU1.Bin050]